MIKDSFFPIKLNVKLDPNSDFQLNELQKITGKKRSQLIRLIIQDFFSRNEDILDNYYTNKGDVNISLFADLLNNNSSSINEFQKFKQTAN